MGNDYANIEIFSYLCAHKNSNRNNKTKKYETSDIKIGYTRLGFDGLNIVLG